MTKKILVLGACGFVGRRMVERLGPDAVLGTYFRQPRADGLYFDALTQDLGAIIPDRRAIRHAMIFYGDTHPDSCASDPARSHALNVESTARVIDRLVDWDIPFTFTSSESVFDGSRHLSTERDIANPIMLYGRQKLLIEHYLATVHPAARWTVMRLGKVYGDSADNDKLFTGWIAAVLAGRLIRIATDQIFSPVFVDDVVGACVAAADRGLTGLYHLCGPRAYARDELLRMLLDELGRHRTIDPRVEPCSIDDFNLPEPRPKDVSMRPDKLVQALGFTLTPAEDICRKVVLNYLSRP